MAPAVPDIDVQVGDCVIDSWGHISRVSKLASGGWLLEDGTHIGRDNLRLGVYSKVASSHSNTLELVADITSVERIGIQKGIRQGLLKGIELGLRLKFGTEGLELLPEISELKDVHLLEAVLERLETASTLDELRQIY